MQFLKYICLQCKKVFEQRRHGKYKPLFCSNECRGLALVGKQMLDRENEKHWGWKGNNAGYLAIHTWLYRHYGQPSQCENCGKDGLVGRQIHWANKTGNYLRDRTDWLRLCASCHREYDIDNDNFKDKSWNGNKRKIAFTSSPLP